MNSTEIHYVYRITNLKPIDERLYYIGVRTVKNQSPENDTYMSSSKSLKEAIEIHGLENFKKDILSIWSTRKEAVLEEIRLHALFNVSTNKEYYNKVNQTTVGFDTAGLFGIDNPLYGFKHSVKFSEDISLRQKGQNNSFFGKHHKPEAIKRIKENTSGEKNHFFGKRHSEESIIKIKLKSGLASANTKYMFNLEIKQTKRIKENEIEFYINNGWKFGRKIFK